MLPVDAFITFIYVEDLSRSTVFYEEILQLPLAADQGSCRIYRIVSGNAYVGICERGERPVTENLILTIVTDAVDAWYQRLIDKGVSCESAPKTNDTYGIYHFFARDPDGYRIEIQRFLADAWDQS